MGKQAYVTSLRLSLSFPLTVTFSHPSSARLIQDLGRGDQVRNGMDGEPAYDLQVQRSLELADDCPPHTELSVASCSCSHFLAIAVVVR